MSTIHGLKPTRGGQTSTSRRRRSGRRSTSGISRHRGRTSRGRSQGGKRRHKQTAKLTGNEAALRFDGAAVRDESGGREAEAVEVEIDHRRGVKGQNLADD